MPVLLPFQGAHCVPPLLYIPGEEPAPDVERVRWYMEEQPALFAYRQTFQFPGESAISVRQGVMGMLNRAEAAVLPHEQTFPSRVEACRASLASQATDPGSLLLWCADHQGRLQQAIRENEAKLYQSTDRFGCRHEVWAIQEKSGQRAVQAALENESLFLADGHHRYAAGWNLATVQVRSPALRSLASHRLVLHAVPDRFPALQMIDDVEAFLKGGSRCVVATRGPVLRGFDMPAHMQAQEFLDDPTIQPIRGIAQAIEAVETERAHMALLVSPYNIVDLEQRARSGMLLAPQSTDFFPKLMAGLITIRH